MSDQDKKLFDQPTESQPQAGQEQAPQQPQNEPENKSSEKPVLVYGDRVFSSEEEIIKKMLNADAFIDQLKDENKALREQLEALKSELTTLKEQQTMIDPMQNVQGQEVETPSAPVSEEALAQLVENMLQKKQQETVLQKNIREAEEAFIAKYGDKAQEVLLAKTKELGITLEHAQQLAATSPQAFKKLLLDGEGSAPATPSFQDVPKVNPTSVPKAPEQTTPLYKLKGAELQRALAERAKRIAEEKGIQIY